MKFILLGVGYYFRYGWRGNDGDGCGAWMVDIMCMMMEYCTMFLCLNGRDDDDVNVNDVIGHRLAWQALVVDLDHDDGFDVMVFWQPAMFILFSLSFVLFSFHFTIQISGSLLFNRKGKKKVSIELNR